MIFRLFKPYCGATKYLLNLVGMTKTKKDWDTLIDNSPHKKGELEKKFSQIVGLSLILVLILKMIPALMEGKMDYH